MGLNENLKVGTLFSGIGSFEVALSVMGIKHEIMFAVDNGEIELDLDDYDEKKSKFDSNIDREKIKNDIEMKYKMCRKQNFVEYTYKANHQIKPEHFFQDVRFFDGYPFKGLIDILVGGSPCQSFSTVGQQAGLEDSRGTLFYEFARIVNEVRPKVFIYENVRGLFTHDKGNTWKVIKSIFSNIGYNFKYEILDAKDFGSPQTRRRLFVVGFLNENSFNKFNFPTPVELELNLQDILLDNVGEMSFLYKDNKFKNLNNIGGSIPYDCVLSEKLLNYVMKGGTGSFYQKPEIDLKIARPLLKTMGNHHRAGIDNYVTSEDKVRRLHEREAARLMGFPDDFKIIVSRAQAYKQFGNSIVVQVFIELLFKIFNAEEFEWKI